MYWNKRLKTLQVDDHIVHGFFLSFSALLMRNWFSLSNPLYSLGRQHTADRSKYVHNWRKGYQKFVWQTFRLHSVYVQWLPIKGMAVEYLDWFQTLRKILTFWIEKRSLTKAKFLFIFFDNFLLSLRGNPETWNKCVDPYSSTPSITDRTWQV